jgi:hypothetical protein
MLPHPAAALLDSSPVPLQWQSSVSGHQTAVCLYCLVVFHIPTTVVKLILQLFALKGIHKELQYV